jgi:hypothetical protein
MFVPSGGLGRSGIYLRAIGHVSRCDLLVVSVSHYMTCRREVQVRSTDHLAHPPTSSGDEDDLESLVDAGAGDERHEDAPCP